MRLWPQKIPCLIQAKESTCRSYGACRMAASAAKFPSPADYGQLAFISISAFICVICGHPAMKLLENPIVVGALALVAVAVVGYQVFSSGPGRGRTHRPQPSAPAPAAPVSSPPIPWNSGPTRTAPSKETPAAPSAGIDRGFVALHFANWVDTGRRDPFLLHQALNQTKSGAPSPVSKWKLRAIWRQTGSRVAAINNGTYKEGDV